MVGFEYTVANCILFCIKTIKWCRLMRNEMLLASPDTSSTFSRGHFHWSFLFIFFRSDFPVLEFIDCVCLCNIQVGFMEWYHVDSLPKHQSQQTSFQLQERWKQWSGDSHSHSHSPFKFTNRATDEVGFSCQSSIENLEMDRVLCQRNQAEIPCVQVEGMSDESSLYWSTLLNNQDYQLTGLSWMNQTDENFMYKLNLVHEIYTC